MRNYILCDIDHVISNSFWRDPMIGGEGGWDAYHQASVDDEPIQDMVTLMRCLSKCGFEIIGITARPSKWRRITQDWLVKHDIPLDELLMRHDTDYRPATEIKQELAMVRFDGLAGLRENVMIALDDREDVTEMFRSLGITTLQVHARYK